MKIGRRQEVVEQAEASKWSSRGTEISHWPESRVACYVRRQTDSWDRSSVFGPLCRTPNWFQIGEKEKEKEKEKGKEIWRKAGMVGCVTVLKRPAVSWGYESRFEDPTNDISRRSSWNLS
uniref:Uncharacterized protein n=1 Tax=Vespula pensylvanica TaxID=30213 RepID=A0A834PH34_VESPE|nr:hypothetical protein H0235_001826 [Vespula pensylvanica]